MTILRIWVGVQINKKNERIEKMKKLLAVSVFAALAAECVTNYRNDGGDSAQPAIAEPAPPTLTVRAELNGLEASGARMQTMSGHVLLPYDWPDRLTRYRSYGPYLVQYSDGCNNYYGSFKIDGVNWNGHTNITVRLDATWPEDIRPPARRIQNWAS